MWFRSDDRTATMSAVSECSKVMASRIPSGSCSKNLLAVAQSPFRMALYKGKYLLAVLPAVSSYVGKDWVSIPAVSSCVGKDWLSIPAVSSNVRSENREDRVEESKMECNSTPQKKLISCHHHLL